MANVTLFSGSIGVNNRKPSERLPYSIETGVAAMSSSMDVIIDQSGAVCSVGDRYLALPGSWHSFYPVVGKSKFYAVQDRTNDSSLHIVNVDPDGSLTETGIWAGLSKGSRMSYTMVGSKVYYANGSAYGCIENHSRVGWPQGEWFGQDEANAFERTPVGSHLATLAGRILTAVGNTVYYTENAQPGLCNMIKNKRRFDSPIRMIASTRTGAFISTDTVIHFLGGKNPNEWTDDVVAHYPALKYGNYTFLVNPKIFGLESTQLSALFATEKGPVIGMPDGTLFNLIENNVVITPESIYGAIMVVDDTLILQS